MSDVIPHLWYADKAEEAPIRGSDRSTRSMTPSPSSSPVPTMLAGMMKDPDRVRAKPVAEAMLGMVELDIAGLQKAYDAR